MELWIRSQDKEDLIKVSGVRINCFNEKEIKGYFNDDDIIIGIYNTKERALEVLDEIQTHLLKMSKTEMLTNENGIINGIKDYGIVYEMPKN